MRLSDETLMAYVDGELDAAGRVAVEQAMAAEPEVRARVEREEKLRAQLRAGFDGVLAEPVPQRLLDAARYAPDQAAVKAPAVADLSSARVAKVERSAQVKRRWALPHWGAIAASLVLGIFVGQAVLRGPESGPMASRDGWLVARGDLADALSQQLASAQADDAVVHIGLSYQNQSGAYCRTFVMRAREGAVGVACRTDEDWRVQVLAQGTGVPAGSGGYRMAGVELPPAVLSVVEGQISGEPLDANAEIAAQRRGWR